MTTAACRPYQGEMELLNYRIVDEPTAMGLPPEGANAAPPDREQEAAMAAVGEFLKNYHAGYLVGKIGAKEFIAICDAEMARQHTGKDPRHAARVLAARSQAYKDTGDMARAQADAEAAVAADAQNDDAHSALAQAYAGQGRYDKALESLEKAKAVTSVAQRKQRYEEQARVYRALTSPQARAVQGVWKVDPHKTLDNMDDQAQWRRNFERNDTHPNALFIAFDLEKSICKRLSSNVTDKITSVAVQEDGKTVVIRCGNEKEEPLILTPLGDSELMLTRAGRGWRQDWYYKKIADNPARYYTNWKYTDHARSDMFLTSDSPPPAWMDKRNMPATPAPQSSAAPSGKGGGLARLDGVWYFDLAASLARYPERADRIRETQLAKIAVDVSAKKLAFYENNSDTPKSTGGFSVSSDDGNRVVLGDISFFFENDNTVRLENLGYVFTRKKPQNAQSGTAPSGKDGGLARLNGVWHFDLAASITRYPERADSLKSDPLVKMVFDVPAKKLTVYMKNDNEPKQGDFVVFSDDGNQVVLSDGKKDAGISFTFADDNTILAQERGRGYVFTRKQPPAGAQTAAAPAGAQATTPAGAQTSAKPATPADVLPRLDGVWNLDVKASEEQSQNASWGKLDAFSLSFDVQKKRFETTDTASGKRLFAGPFSLKAAGESVVLVRNAVETYCSFADNDTLILSLVDEPQKRLVFTRAK